jgi:hypothetical protein
VTTLWPFPASALEAARFPQLQTLLAGAAKAIAAGAFPATAMLVGEPLSGREAMAVELAAMLICPEGRLACQCHACQRVRQGVHPDLQVVSVGVGHQEIRMEDVQEVLASFRQVPFEGRKRVYVLAHAHTPPLNLYAASALLKTLEEPVPHAHWLLLAANPLRVLPTIVSRAVRLRVPPPPASSAAGFGSLGRALAAGVPASLGVLAGEGEEGEAFLVQARELLRQVLEGDLLALLRLAAMTREAPERTAAFASLALLEARQAQGERAEALLAAAEGWLVARSLAERLRLPLEACAVGLLGPSVAAR